MRRLSSPSPSAKRTRPRRTRQAASDDALRAASRIRFYFRATYFYVVDFCGAGECVRVLTRKLLACVSCNVCNARLPRGGLDVACMSLQGMYHCIRVCQSVCPPVGSSVYARGRSGRDGSRVVICQMSGPNYPSRRPAWVQCNRDGVASSAGPVSPEIHPDNTCVCQTAASNSRRERRGFANSVVR